MKEDAHEVLNNTVEFGALVAHTLLKRGTILAEASRKSSEVLDGLRDGLWMSTQQMIVLSTMTWL